MQKLQAQLGFIAVAAILVLPSSAGAQPLVPPGNSAVNQYTETIPTARGTATTKNRGKHRTTPAEALDARSVRRLSSEGPAGRELAAVVAATAPSAAKPDGSPAKPELGLDEGSALNEVVVQATGTSDSGGMGLLLPLLILIVFVGSAAYLWQRRQSDT